jgi:hypothetical protein
MIDLVVRPYGTFPARLTSVSVPAPDAPVSFDGGGLVSSAELLDVLEAQLATLPTVEPAEAGQLWLNNGVPTLTA